MNSSLATAPGKIQVITDNGLPPAGGFDAQDALAKGGNTWVDYCAKHGRRMGYLAHDTNAGVSIYTPIAWPEGFDAFLARYRAHRQASVAVVEKKAEPDLQLVDASTVRSVGYYQRYCPECGYYIAGMSPAFVATTAGRQRLIQCNCGAYLERE